MTNVGGKVNHIGVLMPPVFTNEEIQAIQRMRECVDDFIQLSLRTIGREPSNAEVKAHLDLSGRLDVVSKITCDIQS